METTIGNYLNILPIGSDATPQARKAAFDKAADSFEAMFVSQLIRGMRESLCKDFWGGAGFGKKIYASWFDQALSDAVVRAGGIGVKDQLQRWVFAGEKETSPSPTEPGDQPLRFRGRF